MADIEADMGELHAQIAVATERLEASVEHMKRYYAAYRKLMDHWEKVLPKDVFYTVNYRKLVTDTKNEIDKLSRFCGEPLTAPSPGKREEIRTASARQARDPINRKGLNVYDKYRKFISF